MRSERQLKRDDQKFIDTESGCYWKVSRTSLFFLYFVFLDTKEHLAKRLFIRHNVLVWFGKEYVKKDCQFVLITCKVRKMDLGRFVDALDGMERMMILKGYSDYPAFCMKMDNLLKNQKPEKEALKKRPVFQSAKWC